MHESIKEYLLLFTATTIILILMLCSLATAAPVEVLTVAYEASGEPFAGQVAVAKVIQNRAKERKLTPKEVVFQKHQFSCWRDGKPTQSRELTRLEIKTAQRAWEAAKRSTLEANLYHADYASPRWAKRAKKITKIGNHIFYKE